MTHIGGGQHGRIIPVFVVLPPKTLLLDVAGPVEVLRYASDYQDEVGFDLTYLATGETQTTTIGLSLSGLAALPETLPADAMVMLCGGSSMETGQTDIGRERRVLADWLRRVLRGDTTVVSICSGALIGAEAGVFDGYQCTTHADCVSELRRLAPLSDVRENRLFVEDGRRFSSAGISTGIDLLLHIVSSLTSPAIAARIAQTMVIYVRRAANDPQISPWLSGRNHIHPSVHKAQDAIVADPSAEWSLDRLARVAGLSERHLSRLFREHAGLSVVDYVNLMRVNLARDILVNSRLDMEAVAERCGFASARHLRRVWQQHHAQPPSSYRTLSA